MLIFDKPTLLHPKLNTISVKDQIKLLVSYKLRTNPQNWGDFGKKVLFYGS